MRLRVARHDLLLPLNVNRGKPARDYAEETKNFALRSRDLPIAAIVLAVVFHGQCSTLDAATIEIGVLLVVDSWPTT